MIEIKKVSPKVLADVNAVWSIAGRLREQDRQEVWLASGSVPKYRTMQAFRTSTHTWVATINGQPECVFGVSDSDHPGAGTVWMLGTDEVLKCRRALLVKGREVVESMLTQYPTLFNLVHVDNLVSIAWLKRLGFTLMPQEEHGPFGAFFIPFFRTTHV